VLEIFLDQLGSEGIFYSGSRLFSRTLIEMPSRKNRASRKNRSSRNRNTRNRKNRSRRNRCWTGGMAPVNDTSMTMAQRDSLAQGNQFLNIHKGQHGGAASPAPYPTAVTNSVLSGPMIAATRTGPLDTAMSQIQGMQDGGRRRRNKKSRSRKTKKHGKKHRKHRGGAKFAGASLSENPMLMPSGMERQAALHKGWADAADPNAFVPKP